VRPGGLLAAGAAASAAWGLFEAQWVQCRRLAVAVPGLPPELAGLRILHLSDPHLGSVSLNARALARAASFGARSEPDLVAVTGDLLARQRGEDVLRRMLAGLRPAYGTFAVLGNVDVADTRDPFSSGGGVAGLAPHATVLEDTAVSLEINGCRVHIAGLRPESRYAPDPALADEESDLRILLAHFPDTVDRLPRGRFALVLSGHTHGGQICLPHPGGKVRFGGLCPPYPEGIFEFGATTLVVSRGIGTTFVPFRFCARPEASLLVLEPARGRGVGADRRP
jgi:predicted MPP superfamily phosphohydrolase